MENKIEARSLELIREMQEQLSSALNSLGGKQHKGLEDNFPFYSASHINRAAEGYIFLRKELRVDASRLLIRPAIESVIKILAVRKKPDLLYRIAYTERLEDRKWMRGPALKAGINYDAEDKKEWDEITEAYAAHFPEHPLVEEKLSLRCGAAIAGIESYYDSHYRLYCQFTHAAFRAVTGNLDELYAEDNRTMALCALTGLEAVMSVGASGVDIDAFRKRLFNLYEPAA